MIIVMFLKGTGATVNALMIRGSKVFSFTTHNLLAFTIVFVTLITVFAFTDLVAGSGSIGLYLFIQAITRSVHLALSTCVITELSTWTGLATDMGAVVPNGSLSHRTALVGTGIILGDLVVVLWVFALAAVSR